MQKLLGLLVLGLAFMIGAGTVGCSKKDKTPSGTVSSGAGPTQTHRESIQTTGGATHIEKAATTAEKGSTKATAEKSTKTTK